MTSIPHCGKWNNVDVKQLQSIPPAYTHQILYRIKKCEGKCGKKIYYWAGRFPNGRLTDLYKIPASQHAAWDKRARPAAAEEELKRASDYSLKTCRSIDSQVSYQQWLRRKRLMPWKNSL
jgi:hypothetical protein